MILKDDTNTFTFPPLAQLISDLMFSLVYKVSTEYLYITLATSIHSNSPNVEWKGYTGYEPDRALIMHRITFDNPF